MKKLREKISLFVEFFLLFFNSFWTLGKNFTAGVSGLQSKCTLEQFEKSLCSTNETFFWKFLPISIKKNIVFSAIIFETVVETACFGYRRLLWEEETFWWVFLILIFALPKKWFRSWDEINQGVWRNWILKVGMNVLAFSGFFRKWTDISLKSKTLGKFRIKKSQVVWKNNFLSCWKSSEKQDTRQTPGFYERWMFVRDAF